MVMVKAKFFPSKMLSWVRTASGYVARPEGKRGRIITVGNFKGGVAKTTTAVSLAQALTLRGRRVLVIDCDPQSTYWHRLDLIPALSVLFDAEFIIPSRVIKTSRFQFWDILNKGIKPLTES